MVCAAEEFGDFHGLAALAVPIAAEEVHLLGEACDTADAFAGGGDEFFSAFVFIFLDDLLQGGDGREGVADFMGEVPRHLADEAEFVGLDFELHGALVLGDVVEHEECGVGSSVCA